MERRPDSRDEDQPQEGPIPADAPVETPEADPRTPGAPDKQGPGTDDKQGPGAGSDDDETTEEIGDAFR